MLSDAEQLPRRKIINLFRKEKPVSPETPGATGAVQLHGHQKAGVWRILQTSNTLLAHVVGAGKTYTMVAAAMELKRVG
jgi:N12 class adenine-specific DNA methylase